MSNLVRVYRGITKPGKEETFKEFFIGDAVAILRQFDGFVSVQIGLPTEVSPREFLMITKWKDIDALKAFAGEDWQQAYVDPREEPLLDQVHVSHYWEAEI